MSKTPLGPTARTFGGKSGIFIIGGIGNAFIKGHGNIRVEGYLDIHRYFRRQKFLRSVYMGTEGHAVFRNLSHLSEAKNLKTATIGKNRILPIHKAMNPAGFMNQILTGPQKQMISIAQNDLSSHVIQFFRSQRLNRSLCTDRHEHGGLISPVRST